MEVYEGKQRATKKMDTEVHEGQRALSETWIKKNSVHNSERKIANKWGKKNEKMEKKKEKKKAKNQPAHGNGNVEDPDFLCANVLRF